MYQGRGGGRGRGGGGKVADQPCPQCGGDMWDNSMSKRNPRAPDYVCKDRQNCDGAVWLDDTGRNAAQGRQQIREGGGNVAGPANPQRPSHPPIILDAAMAACIAAATAIISTKFEPPDPSPEGIAMRQGLILNCATTLYISRTRDKAGILKAEKPKAPPAPPPPPPPHPEYDVTDPENDLPF